MGQTALSLAQLGGVPYLPPAKLAASGAVNMAAGAGPSPAPLVLRNLAAQNRAVELEALAVDNTAGVQVSVYADDLPQLNTTASSLEPFPTPNAFGVKAYRNLLVNFLNTSGSAISGFRYFFTLKVWTPSIMEKILQGTNVYPLTDEEKAIAADPYGTGEPGATTLYDLIAQGITPLDFEDMIQTEYYRYSRVTLGDVVALNQQPAGTPVTYEDLAPSGSGQFLVLESVQAGADTLADDVTITIGIDGQEQFLTIPTYPLDGSDLSLFLPAQSEIKLTLTAISGQPAAALAARTVYSRRRVTPLLLVRWGLTTQADLATQFREAGLSNPGLLARQLWHQVKAGLR